MAFHSYVYPRADARFRQGNELVYWNLHGYHATTFVFGAYTKSFKVGGAVALCHAGKCLHVAFVVFGENSVLQGKFLGSGLAADNVKHHKSTGARKSFGGGNVLIFGWLHLRQRAEFAFLCINRKKAT